MLTELRGPAAAAGLQQSQGLRMEGVQCMHVSAPPELEVLAGSLKALSGGPEQAARSRQCLLASSTSKAAEHTRSWPSRGLALQRPAA